MQNRTYWIISQLFFPNETSTGFVMTNIAEKLLQKGNVNVICGPKEYQSSTLLNKSKLDERIIIYRIKAYNWNKDFLLTRVIGFVIITLKISFKILKNVKKGEELIIVTNPPLLIVFVSLLKRIKKFKLTVILQDIFPENLVPAKIISSKNLFFKLVLRVFNHSFSTADHLIACGEDMKELFISKTKNRVPISVITNWADHEEIFPTIINRNEYLGLNLEGKLVIEFAGNIGRVQALDKFIEIFLHVSNPIVLLLIIGDGAFKTKIKNICVNNKQKNIFFLDSKPRYEQNLFLNACEIGLITLAEGMFGLGVPSKVYNVLSAGKPILYIGDKNSEVDNYISDYDVGWSFSWNEKDKIIAFLKNLNSNFILRAKEKGINGRNIIENQFNKDYILNQYLRV